MEKDEFFSKHIKDLEMNYEKRLRETTAELLEMRNQNSQYKERNHNLSKQIEELERIQFDTKEQLETLKIQHFAMEKDHLVVTEANQRYVKNMSEMKRDYEEKIHSTNDLIERKMRETESARTFENMR